MQLHWHSTSILATDDVPTQRHCDHSITTGISAGNSVDGSSSLMKREATGNIIISTGSSGHTSGQPVSVSPFLMLQHMPSLAAAEVAVAARVRLFPRVCAFVHRDVAALT